MAVQFEARCNVTCSLDPLPLPFLTLCFLIVCFYPIVSKPDSRTNVEAGRVHCNQCVGTTPHPQLMTQGPNSLWPYETLSMVLLRAAADHCKAMTASHTIPVAVGTAPVCAQMLALRPVLPAHFGNRQGQVLGDLDLELPRRCRRRHPLAMAEGLPATTRRKRRWLSKAAACGNHIRILYMTARTVPTVTVAAAIFSMIGAAHGTAAVGVVVVVVNVIGANIRQDNLLIGAIIRRDEIAQHLHHALHEATQVMPETTGHAATTASR